MPKVKRPASGRARIGTIVIGPCVSPWLPSSSVRRFYQGCVGVGKIHMTELWMGECGLCKDGGTGLECGKESNWRW